MCYYESMKKPPYAAPEFTLYDSEGNSHSLADYRGKWVVLYFYPKDSTPGCTVEACAMRDVRDDLTDIGTEIIGISLDPPESHEKFKAKYNLKFTLLTDEDRSVLDAYGAWGKKQFGREGVLRKTFIINPEGVVVKAFGRVIPAGHGKQVKESLVKLQAE